MEKELEQLRSCYLEHNQSIVDMEKDIMSRVQILQNTNRYESQVKVFKKFQIRMLEYLQSSEVQGRLFYRRQTNSNIQKIILQLEEDIQTAYKQIRFYESEIVHLQYANIGVTSS
jgi:hypothetical protein